MTTMVAWESESPRFSSSDLGQCLVRYDIIIANIGPITSANTSLGALLPIMAARTKRMRVPPVAFFITKYFGSGVIVATAFIHVSLVATAELCPY
jgi:hypothetical protein